MRKKVLCQMGFIEAVGTPHTSYNNLNFLGFRVADILDPNATKVNLFHLMFTERRFGVRGRFGARSMNLADIEQQIVAIGRIIPDNDPQDREMQKSPVELFFKETAQNQPY